MAESFAMQGRVIEAEPLIADISADEGGAPQQCIAMERRWFDALRERGDHDTHRDPRHLHDCCAGSR